MPPSVSRQLHDDSRVAQPAVITRVLIYGKAIKE